MCQNWTTYILSIEPNKETSVSYKSPLSPNDSNATSGQHGAEPAHEWGLFSQHFAEWRPRRRQGHFNWPFSTPRPPNQHSGHRGRVTFTASQRVKDGRGVGGGQEWKTRGPSLLTVMNEWITTRFGEGLRFHTGGVSDDVSEGSTPLHLQPHWERTKRAAGPD